MANDVQEAWSSELRLLLDKMQHHPSAVTEQDRERLKVLRELVRPAAAAA